MPTITVSIKDMEKMIGMSLPRRGEELDEIFESVKAEVEEINGDNLRLEIKGNDRPDTWNVEGIARQIKGHFDFETGLAKYSAKKSNYRVIVDKKLKKVRPYIACVVAKNIKITPYVLEQLVQQQEKLHGTYGRNRKKMSIGLYNVKKIKFPLKYTITPPDKNPFVPLDWDKKATPQQILEEHEKGREYTHILKDKPYPIFIDAKKNVLSFPPIINSNDLGNVQVGLTDILVEVTGTDIDVVNSALVIMALTLKDRGADIYSVKIEYSYRKPQVTPIFDTEKCKVSVKNVNDRLGMNFTPQKIASLLKKARYGTNIGKRDIEVEIPCYRTDIMHEIDIIEDIAIAYGYNKFVPDPPRIHTIGDLSKLEKFSDNIRELMLGFGTQEVITFTLVSRNMLTNKVNMNDTKPLGIENPMSESYTHLRNALTPTLLEFLSKNTNKKFPQRIFEVGECILPNTKNIRKLGCAISHDTANITEIKSILTALEKSVDKEFNYKPVKHPTFIEGRCGEILLGKKHLGIFGEIHPQVLENFKIEKPVIMFEMNIEELM